MADDEYTHLDVFSGLGGFAIAAREAGFRTVAFCESDTHCQRFLERAWGLPVHTDIRGLDGRQHRGVSLLTGGPPCQPASRAGKRQGAADDRWLWPEALRVLEEAMPDSVVFENPPGIYDVGIDGILSEMERIGYEVQPFDIPACSVDSPQLRYRVWIVGFLADNNRGGEQRERRSETVENRERENGRLHHGSNASNMADTTWDSERRIREETGTNGERIGEIVERDLADNGRERCGQDQPERGAQGRNADGRDSEKHLADCAITGHQGTDTEPGQARRPLQRWEGRGELGDTEIERGGTGLREERPEQHGNCASDSDWSDFVWVPCADGKFRRAPNESFDVVNGLHRSVLAALGNSIVPQVAVQILNAIKIVIASGNVGC